MNRTSSYYLLSLAGLLLWMGLGVGLAIGQTSRTSRLNFPISLDSTVSSLSVDKFGLFKYITPPAMDSVFGHLGGVTTLEVRSTVLAGIYKEVVDWGSINPEVRLELFDAEIGMSLGIWQAEAPRFFRQEAPSNRSWTVHFQVPVSDIPRHLVGNSLRLGLVAHLYNENNASDLPSSDTSWVTVNLPPTTWLYVEFGDFRVSTLNRMGRPWDYTIILGKNSPEFYWNILHGENIIYTADQVKCEANPDFYYEQTQGYWIKYLPGDNYSLEVRENDDIKTELAGTYSFPKIQQALPITDEALAFDQISDAHLHLEKGEYDTLAWLSGVEVKEVRIEQSRYHLSLRWIGRYPSLPAEWSPYYFFQLWHGKTPLFPIVGKDKESYTWNSTDPQFVDLDKSLNITFDTLAGFNPDSLRLVVTTYAAKDSRQDFHNRVEMRIPWLKPRKNIVTLAYFVVGIALLSFIVILIRGFRK